MKIQRTRQFAAWIDALKDVTARARILARIGRLAEGHPGDHRHLGTVFPNCVSMQGRATACTTPSAAGSCWFFWSEVTKAHSNAISKRPGRLHVPC